MLRWPDRGGIRTIALVTMYYLDAVSVAQLSDYGYEPLTLLVQILTQWRFHNVFVGGERERDTDHKILGLAFVASVCTRNHPVKAIFPRLMRHTTCDLAPIHWTTSLSNGRTRELLAAALEVTSISA